MGASRKLQMQAPNASFGNIGYADRLGRWKTCGREDENIALATGTHAYDSSRCSSRRAGTGNTARSPSCDDSRSAVAADWQSAHCAHCAAAHSGSASGSRQMSRMQAGPTHPGSLLRLGPSRGGWMASAFFAGACATISASSFSSTYILRSRAFSASSPFIQFPTNLRYRHARFRALERIHDLAIREIRLLHCVELPLLEILLPVPLIGRMVSRTRQ